MEEGSTRRGDLVTPAEVSVGPTDAPRAIRRRTVRLVVMRLHSTRRGVARPHATTMWDYYPDSGTELMGRKSGVAMQYPLDSTVECTLRLRALELRCIYMQSARLYANISPRADFESLTGMGGRHAWRPGPGSRAPRREARQVDVTGISRVELVRAAVGRNSPDTNRAFRSRSNRASAPSMSLQGPRGRGADVSNPPAIELTRALAGHVDPMAAPDLRRGLMSLVAKCMENRPLEDKCPTRREHPQYAKDAKDASQGESVNCVAL
jgi:hypothetical protein